MNTKLLVPIHHRSNLKQGLAEKKLHIPQIVGGEERDFLHESVCRLKQSVNVQKYLSTFVKQLSGGKPMALCGQWSHWVSQQVICASQICSTLMVSDCFNRLGDLFRRQRFGSSLIIDPACGEETNSVG